MQGDAAGETVTGLRPDGTSAAEDFEDFYRRQLEWARRLTFVLIGDDRDSDDIVQDAFLRIRPHFEALENPRAYLRITIVNACRRYHRRELLRRRAYQHVESSPPELSPQSLEILDLLDRLPVRQRAVLVLRYFDGLSEAEIAETMSCRPGTVKSLAARGLARLRKETTP